MKNNKNVIKKPSINRQDFIDFLASSTPEEINKYILEKGKPRKVIHPMFFFDKNNEENKVD